MMNCSIAVRRVALCVASFIVCWNVAAAGAAEVVETDVCIYGGTSGGVTAAVQASRLGRSVALVTMGTHLGGMTSGGLGWTDTGNTAAIGGLSREFYRRVGAKYGQTESFTFEPKVAEQVFQQMVQEARVPVYYGRRLASVIMDGQRIREIVMENGDVFRARMFIDTTYEGDLMAMAGVTFTWGREGTNTYGESLNGIRANTPNHQFVAEVDPYVTPGDPGSGLLPYIAAGDGGTPGDGDARLQAYNYRLCLTQTASNRLAIAAPTNYNVANYELLARYIQSRIASNHTLNLRSFLKIDALPNGKTDVNNQGAFSTDFIGMNYTYATNTWAERDQMWREHENYIRGLLHFLGNDPRVPQSIRDEMNSWGLCKDEFQDTGGWPHQLYVREARRMISDYVMQQQNCQGLRGVTDSVGLASYTMDSHNVQRVLQNGVPRNEGDVQVAVAAPYPISYRSIVPRVGECENLFVTFALSASHMGFGSCRMEPVFMITSQSAATAAAIALNDNLTVQQVPYGKLRAQLLADRQILHWGSSAIDPASGIIVDTEDSTGVSIVGTWTNSVGAPGYHGANYLHDGNTNQGSSYVRFTPTIATQGLYSVYLRWTENANRATNASVTIEFSGGVTNLLVNQRTNGGVWALLATLPFDAGTSGSLILSNVAANGYVVADAALWLPPTAPTKVVEVFSPDAVASEDGDKATVTFWRSGDTAGDLTIPYTITGTATPGTDFSGTANAIVIPSGQVAASLQITSLLDTNVEGAESITITIVTNAAYSIGTSSNVTVTLLDQSFDQWRSTNFSPAQLADPFVSGDTADADGDSADNLAEFLAGTNPNSADVINDLLIERAGTNFTLSVTRHRDAAAIGVTLERSTNLTSWVALTEPAPQPTITRVAPFETLHYALVNTSTVPAMYWRARLAQPKPLPPPTNAAFFFSFDVLTNGNGAFDANVTANSGFPGTPVVTRGGNQFNTAGGASLFTDFRGTNWFGSGGSGTPGHSLGWNPGSSNNSLSLTFSTLGLSSIQVRFDIRSAAGAGGTPPTRFNSFTFDIGSGPVEVPGVNLNLAANNVFTTWSADLTSWIELENMPTVTLTWTFDDLANTPSPLESVRIDNIQVRAVGISQ